MWDAPIVIPKYILTPHPNLVETLEKFCKCTWNFVAHRIWCFFFICIPLLTWPTWVSTIHGIGRGPQIYKNWTSNGGDNWGWCFKKMQGHSFVSDDEREAILENWSAWLDKSKSIQKRKHLGTTYKKCAQLLQSLCNVAYAVLLLHTHKCRPSGGGVHHRVFWHLYNSATNIQKFVWTCHKCLQHARECVDWQQIIYVQNKRVWHRIFVRYVPSCAPRACIGGSLTNFPQKLLRQG